MNPLVRTILQNPADDTPRRVFADWLDENGDPARAEYIRAAVRISESAPVAHAYFNGAIPDRIRGHVVANDPPPVPPAPFLHNSTS